MTKRLPISALKKLAKEFDKDQVIVLAWDKTTGVTHVTTYGKSIVDCEQAAIGGNRIKAFMGWPPEDCNAIPKRIMKRNAKAAKE